MVPHSGTVGDQLLGRPTIAMVSRDVALSLTACRASDLHARPLSVTRNGVADGVHALEDGAPCCGRDRTRVITALNS